MFHSAILFVSILLQFFFILYLFVFSPDICYVVSQIGLETFNVSFKGKRNKEEIRPSRRSCKIEGVGTCLVIAQYPVSLCNRKSATVIPAHHNKTTQEQYISVNHYKTSRRTVNTFSDSLIVLTQTFPHTIPNGLDLRMGWRRIL